MSNTIDVKNKKDYPWWSIPVLFLVLIAMYIFIMSIAIPSLIGLNIPFQNKMILSGITPVLASFIFMLPISLVIFIVQKIRKKSYEKPVKHFTIGATVFMFVIIMTKLIPYFPFLFATGTSSH